MVVLHRRSGCWFETPVPNRVAVGEEDEAVGGDFLAGVGGGVAAVGVSFFYGGDCF